MAEKIVSGSIITYRRVFEEFVHDDSPYDYCKKGYTTAISSFLQLLN